MKQLKLMLMAVIAVFGRLFAFRAKAAQGGGGNFNFRRAFGALCLSAMLGIGGAAFADENQRYFTDIHFSAEKGATSWVRHHILTGKDVNGKNKEGMTPLHLAARNGHVGTVQELLKRWAHLNPRENNGKTPLYLAAEFGRTEVAKVLIEKGAEIDARDKDGKTPLRMAVESGSPRIAEMLFQKGADNGFVHDRGNHGANYTPLHWVSDGEWRVKGKPPKVAEALIKAGADVNSLGQLKFTPLHVAALARKPEIARVLIQEGADIDAVSRTYTSRHPYGGEKPLDAANRANAHRVAHYIREEIDRRARIEREKEHQRWLALSRHEKWNECVPKHGYFLCMFWRFGW